MNLLFEWLSRLVDSWKFWVVVPPWDVGIRVRLGARASSLLPGLHLRVPFVDEILFVNTRLRIATTPPITVKGTGEKARVISAAVGYTVSEPLVAMLHFENPGVAVMAYAQAETASHLSADRCFDTLRASFAPHGIDIEFVRFVEDIELPGLRLLQYGYGITTDNQAAPVSTQVRY